MRIEIENILGIEHAEIKLEPRKVTRIGGSNASGKTSLALACAAVLARDGNPDGVPATEAGKTYVRDETDPETARATLLTDDDATGVTWWPRGGRIEGDDRPPASHAAAVGLIDFTARQSARAMQEHLQAVLLPEVDTVLGQIEATIAPAVGSELAGVMKEIRRAGLEAAEKIYAERARAGKREWGSIARRTWGVKIASDWHPEGWLAALDDLTEADAERAVQAARDALAAVQGQAMITEAEAAAAEAARTERPRARERIDELHERLADARRQRTATKSHVADARQLLQRLTAEQTTLRRVVGNRGYRPCPACGAELRASNDGFVARAEDEAEKKQHKEQYAGLTVRVRDATAAHEAARKADDIALEAVRRLQENIGAARQRLRDLERQAEASGDVRTHETEALMSERERDVEQAIANRDLIRRKRRCDDLHASIQAYLAVAHALGPGGVRAKLIETGLRRFNAGLRQIATVSDWPPVEIMGGRPIVGREFKRLPHRCSESERWRCQAAMQLVAAALTGSQAVVLDRIDLLDPVGQDGFERILDRVIRDGKQPMALLVCGTDENATLTVGDPA